MTELESGIQNAIRDYLRRQGWYVVKIHQSLGSFKVIADLHAIRDGRSLWLEIKTPRGKQSEHQAAFGCAILAHGGEYLVARSVEDVEMYLREANFKAERV